MGFLAVRICLILLPGKKRCEARIGCSGLRLSKKNLLVFQNMVCGSWWEAHVLLKFGEEKDALADPCVVHTPACPCEK